MRDSKNQTSWVLFHIDMPVQIPVTTVPIQLPAIGSRRQQMMEIQVSGFLKPLYEKGVEFWAPGFDLAQVLLVLIFGEGRSRQKMKSLSRLLCHSFK